MTFIKLGLTHSPAMAPHLREETAIDNPPKLLLEGAKIIDFVFI